MELALALMSEQNHPTGNDNHFSEVACSIFGTLFWLCAIGGVYLFTSDGLRNSVFLISIWFALWLIGAMRGWLSGGIRKPLPLVMCGGIFSTSWLANGF